MPRRRYHWKKLYKWADAIYRDNRPIYASDMDLFTCFTLSREEWPLATWELVDALIKYCKQKQYNLKVGLYAEVVIHKNYRKHGLNQIKAFRYSPHRPPNIVVYQETGDFIDRKSYIFLSDISSILGINTWLYHYSEDSRNIFYIYFEDIQLDKSKKSLLQGRGIRVDSRIQRL